MSERLHRDCGGPLAAFPASFALPRQAEQDLLRELFASIPDAGQPVLDIVLGERFVAAQVGARLGIASTLGARADTRDLALARRLTGKPAGVVAASLADDAPLARSIGLAVLNASLPPPPAPPAQTGNVADLLMRWGEGREVVVVGDFPFQERLRTTARSVSLLELRSRAGSAPLTAWARLLGDAALVAITSTALLTRSMAWFLERAAGARIVLVGPSTPFSPVLFARGVEVLAGSLICDTPAVREGVGQGLPFHKLTKLGGRPLLWHNPRLVRSAPSDSP